MDIDRQSLVERLHGMLAAGDSTSIEPGADNPNRTLAVVTAKRWRRSAQSAYSATDTNTKIENAWESKSPLIFSVPFGGYKSWRISSSPLPNWAEVFFLDHLRNYIREVSRSYPFGVRAELTYVSGVMDLVSNLDPGWQQTYIAAMHRLTAHYSDEQNQISVVDIAAEAGVVDPRGEILRKYEVLKKDWSDSLSEPQLAKISSAGRNYRPDGSRNVESMKRAIFRSAIMCDALDSLESRRAYNKFGPRIQLVFGRQPQPAIHIGTCATSTVHFWVADGVIEQRENRLLPRMLGHTSPRQPTLKLLDVRDVRSGYDEIADLVPLTCGVFHPEQQEA
ncbi:hypothetical protein [Rathayibacter sp. Leaf248]|uniref:hypothetical protein n=1 Tax=Rathayibacter sp. Leaf248 TaxID=2876555 RepID=UPI001E3B67E8|nr:hypothetical protein [Rathayibacter sp. Leaf248]